VIDEKKILEAASSITVRFMAISPEEQLH
jgi:hypothetical protein